MATSRGHGGFFAAAVVRYWQLPNWEGNLRVLLIAFAGYMAFVAGD